jgi:hypothetical protein
MGAEAAARAFLGDLPLGWLLPISSGGMGNAGKISFNRRKGPEERHDIV